MNITKRNISLFGLLLLALSVLAQGPNGSGTYYSQADGKKGKELKTALWGVIKSHTQLSYDALWEAFKATDTRSDGKVWDMYSCITNYRLITDKGGNYRKEGDCYNREHSFPKSWFDDAYPMYTDLVHLVPADGYVNGQRSNLPFGETYNPTWSSSGGFSKKGASSISGYSGTVFEPNDEYKGDFARIYFYMATCYEDKIAGWSSDMLARNAYPAYKSWVVEMLLRWAAEDPVSEKEVNRNKAVYQKQGNRNPFVDYPGLEQYVWGGKTDVAFSYDNYDPTNPNPDPTPDPGPEPDPDPTPDPVEGEQIYVKVTSASDLQTGYGYLIVCEGSDVAMAASNENVRGYAKVTVTDNRIVTTVNTSGSPYQFELGGSAGAYTLYDATEKVYLSLTTNENRLNKAEMVTNNAKWDIAIGSSGTSITNNAYPERYINYNNSNPRFACYKTSSSQKPVVLYKNTVATSVKSIAPASMLPRVDVYSITGVKIRSGVAPSKALSGLEAGIYVINKKKYIVK